MNTHPELPDDVVAAIEDGRKIEAIKLLREQRGLDLKSAKEAVEDDAARRPGRPPTSTVSSDSGFRRFVLLLNLADRRSGGLRGSVTARR